MRQSYELQRTECLRALGSTGPVAVCGPCDRQSCHREMWRRPAAASSGQLLVLDFNGSGGTTDGKGMALFDGQRSHARDAQDTGAPGAPHYNHQQINL